MTPYIEVTKINKYMIVFNWLNSVEDAGGHFLTTDEFQKQYGSYDRRITFGIRYNHAAVQAVLTDVKARIQTEKLKSVVIDDQDLVEVLNAVHLNEIDPGLRRIGDRLFLRDTSTSTLRKLRSNNVTALVFTMQDIINRKLNTSFAFSGSSYNYPSTLELLKTQVTWDDIIAESDKLGCCDINMLKSFYDDPSLTADLSKKRHQ